MRKSIALILFLCSVVAGCAIPPVNGTVSSPREIKNLEAHEMTDSTGRSSTDAYDSPVFLSCDFNHDYRLDSNAVSTVPLAWPFALMASNSYRTSAFFTIPNWSLIEHFRGALNSGHGVGFQSDIYVRKEAEKVVEIAVVFRGTDHSADWKTNLSLWWPWNDDRTPSQFQHAEWVARNIKDKYPGIPVVYVGHSLGGGMAFHVGWTQSNARVFAFNTSPRVWSSGTPIEKGRYDIAESGEFLRFVQFWRKVPGIRVRMNFREAGLEGDHNMYYFARALLYQATRQEIKLLSTMQTKADADTPAISASEKNIGCRIM